MLSKQTGNILLGKTPKGDLIRISQQGKKVITSVGETIREKTEKVIQITDEKEIFKNAFPQYNDFKLLLRHDKFSGNKFGTKEYGKLVGTHKDGREIILMRQNKINSGYSNITLGYDTNRNVPVKPDALQTFESEINIYRPSDFQIRPTLYTEITNPFAQAYLKGDGRLKETKNATDEFFRIMREESTNIE